LNLFGARGQNEYQVPCERKKGMITRLAVIPIGMLLWILPHAAHGQTRPADMWRDRFVIRSLTPRVDQEFKHIAQVHMCADPRIHRSELEPSVRGGVTKTRVAVRSEKEGSSYLILMDQEPGYRMFQIFARGYIVRALSWAGAEHVLLGSVSFAGYTFESDPLFPFHFKLVENVGYVHLCGRGAVTTPAGARQEIRYTPGITELVSALAGNEQLAREAACEALGYLAITRPQKDEAVPALVQALEDPAMEVRRNAAEALGRIGDPTALASLEAALKEADDWVREVAAQAIKQITAAGK
jgi:hypothetical protein